MDEQKKGGSAWLWVVVVIVIALISYGGYKYSKKDDTVVPNTNTNTATNTDTTPNTPSDTSPSTSTFKYKDGTYKALGDYNSPGGAEQIDVTLVLKDDVIVSATVVSLATRPNSVTMQGKFVSGFKTLVIGKKLDEVQLDKVSGSSLTPKGWNDAVAEIQAQAKV